VRWQLLSLKLPPSPGAFGPSATSFVPASADAAVHDADSPPLVVVDLLGVDFLDAIGIGVLFAGVVVCRSRGGDLAICRPEPQVAAVLRLTRVDEILPIHPSVVAAEAELLSSNDSPAR
jgi:anti-anti-sigma factor